MDPVEIFGRNVRAARTKKKWTQEDLAAKTGLAPAQISRIERGAREIRLTTLVRLLTALEAGPEALMIGLYPHATNSESNLS